MPQLMPGSNCDSIELGASVQVLEGDVIGVCLSSDDGLRRLDVVSESMDNGYRMLYINSNRINDCASLPGIVLRETAESGGNPVLEELAESLILHIFAEICELLSIEDVIIIMCVISSLP